MGRAFFFTTRLMPTCERCEVEKDQREFISRKHAVGGRHPTCKPCAKELEGLGYKICSNCLRWRWADNFYGKRHTRCSDCYTAYRYKMSPQEYERFVLVNGNACGVCGSESKLVVDHDHETGHIRGRLCHSCNIALGHFRDSEDVLLKAIDYLRKSNRRYTLEASLEDAFWPGEDEVN